MRIAVDAMGSDHFPGPDVEGAVDAAREYGVDITLVGDEARVRAELDKHDTARLNIDVLHAPEYITQDDKPGIAARGKRRSSMHIGLELVRDGKADAFVSAGNTGALLAVATLHTLRRIPGVRRPALSLILAAGGDQAVMVDVGANTDCKPEWLHQFAVMGNIYAKLVLEIERPRVALLANGEEEIKGNLLLQETGALLRGNPHVHFTGNIEPKDIVRGDVDVIVADGFAGNIALKSMEAVGELIFGLLKRELTADLRSKLGALLLKPAFLRVYHEFDPSEYGGAPLLGVNGIVIIGHGRSDARAIKNMIRQARLAVEKDVMAALRDGLAQMADDRRQMIDNR